MCLNRYVIVDYQTRELYMVMSGVVHTRDESPQDGLGVV